MKNTFSFQLLVLYREFVAFTKKELKKLGLNFGQMPLILYTGKHPDCSQTDLTKALDLDWGYSQRSIAKLSDEGFMTKQYDEGKSCNLLHLTERGVQAFDACHEVFHTWDTMKLSSLTSWERIGLITFLQKIAEPKEAENL